MATNDMFHSCISEQDVMPYIYKGKKRKYMGTYSYILLKLIKIFLEETINFNNHNSIIRV